MFISYNQPGIALKWLKYTTETLRRYQEDKVRHSCLIHVLYFRLLNTFANSYTNPYNIRHCVIDHDAQITTLAWGTCGFPWEDCLLLGKFEDKTEIALEEMHFSVITLAVLSLWFVLIDKCQSRIDQSAAIVFENSHEAPSVRRGAPFSTEEPACRLLSA